MTRALRRWHRVCTACLAIVATLGLVWAIEGRAPSTVGLPNEPRHQSSIDGLEDLDWTTIASMDDAALALQYTFGGQLEAMGQRAYTLAWVEFDPTSTREFDGTLLYRVPEQPELGGQLPTDSELLGPASEGRVRIAYQSQVVEAPLWIALYDYSEKQIVARFALPRAPGPPGLESSVAPVSAEEGH